MIDKGLMVSLLDGYLEYWNKHCGLKVGSSNAEELVYIGYFQNQCDTLYKHTNFDIFSGMGKTYITLCQHGLDISM